MVSPSSRPIRFDQLKGHYAVDVWDNPETPSLIADLGRGNLAADTSVLLVVNQEQAADSWFEVFLGADRRDRCALQHGHTVSLFIAPKSRERTPASRTTTVHFRLQTATSGLTVEIPCTVDARLVTQELKRPEIKVFFEPEVTFGVTHGSASAPSEVLIGALTPSLAPSVATYNGPPADLVLQTTAAIVMAPRSPPEPLPVRIGTRPIGRGSPNDVSWSQGQPTQLSKAADALATHLTLTIPFPFDQEPVEIVFGVMVRDAIAIGQRVTDEGELTAEIDLEVSLTLVTEGKSELVMRERPRIAAHFNVASLITVAARDLDPVVLALARACDVDPVQASNTIRRRVNLRSESVNRTSSVESIYDLTIEAFADTRDPRLDVDFALTYEDGSISFPDYAIVGHVLRHGEPVGLPLRAILEASILKSTQERSHVPRRGDLVVSFRFFEFEHSPDPLFARLSIPIEIEMIPPDLVACIDLGTSAMSIWFGMVEGPNTGSVLPLGDLVHVISGDEHEEFEPDLGVNNALLPSLIGLSSDRNLRAKLDPLSFGDIGLCDGGIIGAERRLKSLGRRYDVSVPFVPRQDIPAHRNAIVFHPKRSLMALRARPLSTHAFEMTGGQLKPARQIDVPSLIVDVFDEFGTYLVPRAISHFERLTQHWSGRRGYTLTDIWLEAKQPVGAIVTHPSGASVQIRDVYIEAGRRFLARFTGQPIDPAEMQTSHLWVKLVPEAIAAINYGIGYLLNQRLLPAGKHVLAALDIGAGTYDATIVEAEIGTGGLENWTVLSHFGLTVGGLDLDRAIVDKVAGVLRDAFREPQVKNLLTLDLDPPARIGALNPATQRFAREIAFHDEVQRAKKQLTARLFDLPESAAYVWEAGSDILFEVIVGREPDNQMLPVRRKQSGRLVNTQRIRVDMVGPTWLLIRPNARDGGVEIVLQMGPGHFSTTEPELIDATSPRTVARFLGTVLPRMVMREVRRLKKSAPTWIVTGRTALWPPLYSAIGTVAASEPDSRMASARPFPPSEMKIAVINGALALASNPHLPLGNDILNPLAVVSIAAEAQTADPRRTFSGRRVTRVAAIKYLMGSDQRNGNDRVSCAGRCELVRAVPGLSDPDGQGNPDREALELFDAFGIPPYERLVSDIAQTGSTDRRDLKVTWNAGNRSTNLTIDPGDGRGPQRFEVPNRESRIYHD